MSVEITYNLKNIKSNFNSNIDFLVFSFFVYENPEYVSSSIFLKSVNGNTIITEANDTGAVTFNTANVTRNDLYFTSSGINLTQLYTDRTALANKVATTEQLRNFSTFSPNYSIGYNKNEVTNLGYGQNGTLVFRPWIFTHIVNTANEIQGTTKYDISSGTGMNLVFQAPSSATSCDLYFWTVYGRLNDSTGRWVSYPTITPDTKDYPVGIYKLPI